MSLWGFMVGLATKAATEGARKLPEEGAETLAGQATIFGFGAEATGWVGSDDGLLAFDRNGDGIVTDHSELFGTETDDGFLMLAEFDSSKTKDCFYFYVG